MIKPREDTPSLSGICDCHVHVFDADTERYPLHPNRTYTPPAASTEALVALCEALGVQRTVVVQASPYGEDNTCMLDVLRRLAPHARGVAVVSPQASLQDLWRLHHQGVRGVRVNLETAGESDPATAGPMLEAMAQLVQPLGWHVQTYTNLHVLQALSGLIESLPVPLVVDHFGRAQAQPGLSQPGFSELLALVRKGAVYVKLSAPYRISDKNDYPDVQPLARALIDANPDRMLWGSDWPHPGAAAGPKRPPGEITPNRQEDDLRALRRCIAWAGSTPIARKILVDNPARLYGFIEETNHA
ncbi:hydrolase [Allopusillimonas soli]|uniref:Amidohydrolase family protein n=1 Tax=Allopusillimonas soli TaxID=659016 RepID=A0A853FAM8_9BURK|nr:amidohydrolase family protein [Allopusillimonas soli]NYT35980.1 amidohydrolase family protein [Allopusillimonas soli]TEA76324.1 hydrolase [Allopusillimonas soli]